LPLITWTLAGYTLAQVALQPAIAKFSDNFGRNRVFLVCVCVFTLSSLLCAIAPNVWVLIAFRIVQAMGGSGLLPAATGIVVSAYPARQRERLIGLFTSIIPMGAIIVGWLFVRQEQRAPDPMLDYRIAVLPPFLQVNAYNLLYGMAIFSVMAFVPYFAETRFGMTPAQTGVLLTPRSIMLIVMSTVASVWLLRYGYRRPMLAGTAIVGLGVLFLG